ncbi:unnamed protein product [Caenorhabditis nigoni]
MEIAVDKQFNIGVVIDNWIYDCIWLPVTSVLHVDTLALEDIFILKLGNDYEAYTNFDLWSKKDGKFLHRMECANEPMEIQKALQEHINSIFHYSGSYKLIRSMNCERSLPNITNVLDIEIINGTVDPQFLTNVLKTYPDTQTISVKSKIDGELPEDSPFSQVQNVHIRGLSVSDYIHNFVGRNMRLDQVTVTDQDLIQFLQKWIANEAYHNLETLSIHTEHGINQDLLRQSVELKEYDPNEPEKRPKDYVINIPYFDILCAKYYLNRDFVEIKRITDGKKAFLWVDDRHLDFLVHKN